EAPGGHPGVLIEARERDRVAAGKAQRAIGEHALGVGHVPDDLLDAPFPRGVAVQRLGLGQAGEHGLRRPALILEGAQQVPVGDLVDVAPVVRGVLGGDRAGDGRGGHAALGRPREPAFPDCAGRRKRASLASASGSRRITCSSFSRYVGLLSRARSSPRNGRSFAYTIICSPFTSANICSSMAPCSTRAAAMFQYVVTMRYGALVLPRYTVRISSALDGVNCSRNQARAFRMTGSRRRSYSLSSRSALSYVVVTGGSVIAVVRKLRGLFPGGDPGVPRLLRRAHAQLLLMADQGHAEQQRLHGQLVEPALLREQCRPEAQLREALGVAVDQGADTELLGEAAQLAGRGGPLVEID